MSSATSPATATSPLAGKTALVTGGSRGIGRAIAERLGRDGARVAVHFGSNESAAKETVTTIEDAGGEAFPIGAKLGQQGDAETLWAAFDEHADGLDILVNNAGITGPREPIAGVTAVDFDEIFDVNTKALFFITQLGLPRLRDGGRIINVSTGLTRGRPMPELIAYAMSKGAVDVFTTTLAKQLGSRGIRVNTVVPGIVDTDMNAGWLRGDEEAWEQVSKIATLGGVGKPDDVARVTGFLASEDSHWVTGQWIDASGGSLL